MNITDPIFHDEAKAAEHIFASRWPDGEPICPHCGSTNCMVMGGKTQAGYWLCRDCRDKFTVRTGTVMERSHEPLHKWLLANAPYGRFQEAHVRQANGVYAGRYLQNRVVPVPPHPRSNGRANDSGSLGGAGKIVEADEASLDGNKRKRLSGKVASKKKVVALVERRGRARSFDVANLHGNNVRAALVTSVDCKSTLTTDDARFYWAIARMFTAPGHVFHAGNEFSKDSGVHSTTAENFFSILKRGVRGIYHHSSEAHMHRYLAAFDMRYSTKDKTDGERANNIIKGMEGPPPDLSADWSNGTRHAAHPERYGPYCHAQARIRSSSWPNPF